MITKNDCLLLLADLQSKGIDTQEEFNNLLKSNTIPLDIIKFINDNRQLDLFTFYQTIRKSYNKKKSNLYINIVKEIDDPNEVLTTLSAMLAWVVRYSKTVSDKQMFLKHARASDICRVLNIYFNTGDITNCIKLIRLIKADIKALESIK